MNQSSNASGELEGAHILRNVIGKFLLNRAGPADYFLGVLG